jgi:hypothetical protein
VSAGDQEFRAIIDDLRTKPDFEVDPKTWSLTSRHGPSGPIEIAYLGYPYTFFSRAPEAVPTQIAQLESGGLLAALIQARIHLEMYQTEPQHNKHLRRVSPKAQRFVYETWLRTMKEQGIDLMESYGYDAELLKATQSDDWFAKHTEPRESELDEIDRTVEEKMAEFFAS